MSITKPKGTKDIFGERQSKRTFVRKTLESIAKFYNFDFIETPAFESKKLFQKAIGEKTDVVTKEMYEFEDKKKRELVLRPEGTAPVVRAYIENKMFSSPIVKLYYYGSMFRYERPQKGRQRQFTQFGTEVFGKKSPFIDTEIILMGWNIIKALGLTQVKLVINSLGDQKTRDIYTKELKKYLSKYKAELSDASKDRLAYNPLRILDDKIDGKKDFILNAPKIKDFYTKESQAYFNTVKEMLDSLQIPYEVSASLVRGLDYYSDTIFEIISTSDVTGSQDTLIGGGRYNNLVKELGGPNVSGVGFGLGVERIVNEVEHVNPKTDWSTYPEVFVANIAPSAQVATNSIVYMLRSAGFVTELNIMPLGLTKAFEKASKLKPQVIIIAGLKELEIGKVTVKNQTNSKQEVIDIKNLINYLDKVVK